VEAAVEDAARTAARRRAVKSPVPTDEAA
jgi:hypothetical protein